MNSKFSYFFSDNKKKITLWILFGHKPSKRVVHLHTCEEYIFLGSVNIEEKKTPK